MVSNPILKIKKSEKLFIFLALSDNKFIFKRWHDRIARLYPEAPYNEVLPRVSSSTENFKIKRLQSSQRRNEEEIFIMNLLDMGGDDKNSCKKSTERDRKIERWHLQCSAVLLRKLHHRRKLKNWHIIRPCSVKYDWWASERSKPNRNRCSPARQPKMNSEMDILHK